MSIKYRWLLLLLWISLPLLILGAAGGWWIWQQGWTLWWALLLALIGVTGWPAFVWLQRRSSRSLNNAEETRANPDWQKRERQAWEDVEELARITKWDDEHAADPAVWWSLLRTMLERVARRFHPNSDKPELETPVPHVLLIIEWVADDLRQALGQHIPGIHILTLNDVVKLKRWAAWFPTWYRLYRVAQVAVNPVAAIFREMAGYVQGKVLDASLSDTKQWALEFAIRRAGFYAIELYSGRLVLRDADVRRPTRATGEILDDIQEKKEQLAEEPIKIAVVGQTKAGKSSLIQALFGEATARADSIPCTPGVTPYLVRQNDLPAAIVFDTAGYATGQRKTAEEAQELFELILGCDAVLWVCTATTAARQPDKLMLDQLRQQLSDRIERDPPPFLFVLSHIDLLRPPREWSPPYDLQRDKGPKATSIKEAIQAVSEELHVPPENVIPVCLRPDAVYNVEKVLMPALIAALPAASRSRLARCLKAHHSEQVWSQLWEQAQNAGGLFWQVGRESLKTTAERWRTWWKGAG